MADIPTHLAARVAEVPQAHPSPSPDATPPKFARIISAISGCLNSVANKPKYCDQNDSVNILNTCKFLDCLCKCNSLDGPKSIDEAADVIMSLPMELRLLADSDDDGATVKRVRLDTSSDLMIPHAPSASSDPMLLLPHRPHRILRSLHLHPIPPLRLLALLLARRMCAEGLSAKKPESGTVATLCAHFELSPRNEGIAYIDPAFEAAMGPPTQDVEILSSIDSTSDDASAPPADPSNAHPVPPVSAVPALKPPLGKLSSGQKKKLKEKNKANKS